ncbi:Transcription elongation factor GreA [bacterium HR34]|nr:Transcription elongation factor GreA [bacterium HR34]
MPSNKYTTTKEGLKRAKKELQELKEKRKEIAQRLKEAMSFGDLSENAEYQDAREQQAMLEKKISELEDFIENAIVVDVVKSKNTVSLGSKVELESNGKKFVFELVEPAFANPLEGKISIDSPLGQVLLSKKVGDEVLVETPNGKVNYKILKIS